MDTDAADVTDQAIAPIVVTQESIEHEDSPRATSENLGQLQMDCDLGTNNQQWNEHASQDSGLAGTLSRMGTTLVELATSLRLNDAKHDCSTQTNEVGLTTSASQTNVTSLPSETQAIQTTAAPTEGKPPAKKRKVAAEEPPTSSRQRQVARFEYEGACLFLERYQNAPIRVLFKAGDEKTFTHCDFCKVWNEHFSDACPEVTEATERSQLVKCQRCLSEWHSTARCRTYGLVCWYCGGLNSHHSAVCALPEDMVKAEAVIDAYLSGAPMP